jgi:uncharacterized small protein (DUF1192 family)
MEYMMVGKKKPLERLEVPERVDTAPVPQHTEAEAHTALVVAEPASSPSRPIGPSMSSVPPPVHRRYARTRADSLMVRFRVGDGVVVARVADISMGGLFAPTTSTIPVGAFVEFSLLRPGADEVQVGGVVVDDAERRHGLAVRFEAMTPEAARQVRRIVEELQDKNEGRVNPDRGVERARLIRPAADEVAQRDQEITALRQKIALLTAENNRLRAEAENGAEAEKLVGRLRLEIERLKARGFGEGGLDPELLSDIKRDAELAWTVIARLSDNVDKLK